jgi:hypothetical protein
VIAKRKPALQARAFAFVAPALNRRDNSKGPRCRMNAPVYEARKEAFNCNGRVKITGHQGSSFSLLLF